jgi:hypothetical protein
LGARKIHIDALGERQNGQLNQGNRRQNAAVDAAGMQQSELWHFCKPLILLGYYSKNGSFFGGRGGIRTHGTVSRTPVFKTGSLNHSDTLPDDGRCGDTVLAGGGFPVQTFGHQPVTARFIACRLRTSTGSREDWRWLQQARKWKEPLALLWRGVATSEQSTR